MKKAYASSATKRAVTLEQGCCESSVPGREKLERYGYSQDEFSVFVGAVKPLRERGAA